MIASEPTLIGFFTSLFFLTGLFIYSFFYIFKKERELQKRDREIDLKLAESIKQTHLKSEVILAQAVEDAKKILTETHIFKETVEKDLRMSLQEEIIEYRKILQASLQKTSVTYEKIFADAAHYYSEMTKEVGSKLKQAEEKNIESFRDLTEDQSLTAKFYIQRKVNEELEKAKKEIDEYKKDQESLIQSSIKNFMLKISEEVLDGSLTPEQQEKLIFKALEKAKNSRIFEL